MGRKLWRWYTGRWGTLIAILASGYFVLSFLGDVTTWTPLDVLNDPIARFVAVGLLSVYLGLNWWEAHNRYIDVIETHPNIIATGFDKEIVHTVVRSMTTDTTQNDPYPWLRPIVIDGSITQSTTDSYITVIDRLSQLNVSSKASKGDTFERFYIILRNMKLGENNDEKYFVHIILSGKNLNETNFWVSIQNFTSKNPAFEILKSSPCK